MPAPPSPPAAEHQPADPLRGRVRVPGDKSISHRALMLGALAMGETRIEGLLTGEDVLATASALRAMGVGIERGADDVWTVAGVGVGGLLQPAGALDLGNSGTSARLLMGMIASHPITATLVGDASLSARPMARVTWPLSLMGADFTTSPGDRLPMMMRGVCPATPIDYTVPVTSAQVKTAILLAALNTPGVTRVTERIATRDHGERMLAAFGAAIAVEDTPDGRAIALTGEAELRAQSIVVPGDPSSAAFPVVAALLVPGSDVTIENVGMNPTRTGLFDMLAAMGARIDRENPRIVGGEPVADLRVRAGMLTGIDVPPSQVPSMIDEFPILFVAAALARGTTRIAGAAELRVKESDRIAAMAAGLAAIGARVEERDDGLIVHGSGGEPLAGGAGVAARLDHRIAMSFAVANLVSRRPVAVDDMGPVATSFPGFAAMIERLRGRA